MTENARTMGTTRGANARRRSGTLTAAAVAVALLAGACSGDDGDGTAQPTGTGEPTSATTGAEGAMDTGGGITHEQVLASTGTLDDIVETVMDETGVPGVAVAVVHDDEVVYEQGYGVKSTETGDPVTPETVFQIASLSKPVSSTVMAGLVGEGTFAWDDPIVTYAPDLQLSDQWVTEHVTFADTFAHRTGLPGGPAGNDLEAIGYDRDTILERLALVPLEPFRITYSYSNFAMTLGGEAAAQAAGEPWEDAAERVLFEPAGMSSTSMRHEDFVADEGRALIHVRRDEGWQPLFERQPDAQAPAGGASSNVVDMARWMRLQLAEGMLDGEQIIDAEALDATHTPQVMSRPPAPEIWDHAGFYGLGWDVTTDRTGAVRWNHSGAFSVGTSTMASLLPSEDLGIVVLTNGEPIGVPETITDAYLSELQTGEMLLDEILPMQLERWSGLYGEPVVDVDDPPANPAPARDDAAYVGTYANDYVGEVEVVAGTDGGLELVMGPDDMVFELEHWDGDTFLYRDAPELPDFPATVTFDVTGGDEATSVTISALDGAGLGTLERT